ncbi:methylated-DNA--[protein]-cysteine S-methyltransferase [Spirochaetia bacterium 38H-sp]|uniref:Methylated-DNA--[protein]-cysteine S-methyltransferase n=1 Tax=Rarispira pelagica TaxID=3141764 RepID=A0ABU9U971_9SPIR
MKKITYAKFPFLQGQILLAKTEKGLARINFGDKKYIEETEAKLKSTYHAEENPGKLEQEYIKIKQYWDNPAKTPDIQLDIEGTEFQKKVWHEISKIPAGKTATYTDIAKKIGNKRAIRAVANACAANKIPLIIPCHRVIRKDRTLGGYSGGLNIKEELLRKEKAI